MPRRVRIDLAYDGTDYHGWQVQTGRPTIQGILEQALARIHGGDPVRVRGAGRTDAGAHARGQVADALIEGRFEDAQLESALAGMLPPDIRVKSARSVAPAFHSRHDALEKTYAYRIDRSRSGDPFLARFALNYPWPLDEDAMDAAMALLPGRRDWSGFTGAACEVEDRVRTMTQAIRQSPGPAATLLVFTADGFLTHMVRNLVGTILEIGRGRLPVERIAEVLDSKDRTRAGPTAPAHGLVLEEVRYEGFR